MLRNGLEWSLNILIDAIDTADVLRLSVRSSSGALFSSGFEGDELQSCRDDALEENDTQLTATLVDSPFGLDCLKICQDDYDYFTFSAVSDQTIDVQVLFSDADGDLDAKLINSEGLKLAQGLTSSDNESFDYTVQSDGEFTVQVRGFDGAENDYTLEITVTDPPP